MNAPAAPQDLSQPKPQVFSIDELCTLADVPVRTVRYYIQIGLLDRPEGEKRGAHYLSYHLEKLLRIRQLTDAGVSLERIREVLAGSPAAVPPRPRPPGSVEVWSHLMVADGVELHLEPGRAGLSAEQARAFFTEVSRAFERVTKTGARSP
jgi:DNA-binding transcriptional MerR regulator